jgi:hypothetical protein
MPNSGSTSLLAGLVQGYAGARAQNAHQDLAAREMQQKNMLAYLHEMATNPNVPPEHQQWAMQQGITLAQHDISKPLPKGLGDLSKLPPVSLQQPARQVATQQPTIQIPGAPPAALGPGQAGGGPASPQASAAPSAPSGDVGRSPNGTVNALGAIRQLQMPQPPPNYQALGSPSTTIPATSGPEVIQNPTPPVQIAPGGQLHVLTPSDRLKYATATQQEEMNQLQQQYPGKSQEDLAYFAQHGDFPKSSTKAITPGEELVDERTGRVIATNQNQKPGAKTGYEPVMGPAGIIGVKDVSTGGMLTPEQVASHPEAKAVLQQATTEHQRQLAEGEAKETRVANRQAAAQARAFQYATTKAIEADAIKASRAAAPMVNVLDTSEAYVNGGQFTPRQDLALIVRAVRAMNPGTVRLPNKELEMEIKAGSYGDRFSRWYSTATTGVLPDEQRNDLMNVIREETTQTAKSAADNWQQAYGGSRPLPAHLKRFGGGSATRGTSNSISAPSGATHEAVDYQGNVVGHVVDGKYVPLR